jgi:hypothetical protein
MIEVGFLIVLGFVIASVLCGLIAGDSVDSHIVIRKVVTIIVICLCLKFLEERTSRAASHGGDYGGSVYDGSFLWLILGASIVILVQIVAEGYVYKLWLILHPNSAPTPEARIGQRAKPVRRKAAVAATLMGTSTTYLQTDLDLKTETLIKLCFYAFEDRGSRTISLMESYLRLGTGRRQKSFHKIAAGMSRRPNLKQVTHRYLRSTNGSSRMSQLLFGELCRLAHSTGNCDASTLKRLSQTGQGLALSEGDVRRLMSGAR